MDYTQFKIKTYDNWDLFLHVNQYPFIGRCYAWALREDAAKITDMNKEEKDELFDIVVPAWDGAVSKLFNHDWPNIAIFGNEAPHLHAHFIPRYNTSRAAYGIEFVDPNPRGNYSPYPKKKLSVDLLLKIKENIKTII